LLQSPSDRSNYPSLNEYIYLNQASLGLIGQPAVSAMHRFLDTTARHGNSKMSDAEEVAFLDPLRENAAKLMNCRQENVAIISSASEILNQLPHLFNPPIGSNIVTVSSDFPSITRPWIAYCKSHECKLKFVEENFDQNLTEEIIKAIDSKTSVVCVSYVQFSTGTQLNIKRLSSIAKKYGSRLVVDITQAAGAVPISTLDWDADVLVCSGYKWLGGHGGVALAYISSELLNKTPPGVGWFGAENPFDMQATQLKLSKTAGRYTQSTMSYISVKGLTIAITELLNIGLETISDHSKKLVKILNQELTPSNWKSYRPIEDQSASSHIVTLETTQNETTKLPLYLKNKKIICGSRNGRLRISLAHYNNETDIKTLVNSLL